MDKLSIFYLSVNPDTPSHGYWDHGFLDEYLFPQFVCDVKEVRSIPYEVDGAVVVIPARAQAKMVQAINIELSKLRWCIVMLTGDEEHDFPWRELKHDRMLVWIMSPQKGTHDDASFRIGSGYRLEEPGILKEIGFVERTYDWYFAGQVTHKTREACVAALKQLPNGKLIETKGFGQGLDYREYIEHMARSKFVACPAGPVSPDNFRLYEALEAGCIPIADGGDYWSYLFGEPVPFPVLTSWDKLPELMPELLNNYQSMANRVFAWWQFYKRRMADKLEEQIKSCNGTVERATDDVTVVVPTNPVPSNPSTSVIEQTLASVCTQMPNSEIIVLIDGIRPEMSEYKKNYEEYTARLLHLIKYKFTPAIPILFDSYSHQSLMMKKAIKHISTPLLLFVEHDTPVTREIDWVGIKEVVRSSYAYQVRLSHEGRILPEHKYLMLDDEPVLISGVPLIRTRQWSQRPHLSTTAFYKHILDAYHDDQPRFIEHVMYGILLHGDWANFRTHIYAPDGDMQRTIHLDSRKSGAEA